MSEPWPIIEWIHGNGSQCRPNGSGPGLRSVTSSYNSFRSLVSASGIKAAVDSMTKILSFDAGTYKCKRITYSFGTKAICAFDFLRSKPEIRFYQLIKWISNSPYLWPLWVVLHSSRKFFFQPDTSSESSALPISVRAFDSCVMKVHLHQSLRPLHQMNHHLSLNEMLSFLSKIIRLKFRSCE